MTRRSTSRAQSSRRSSPGCQERSLSLASASRGNPSPAGFTALSPMAAPSTSSSRTWKWCRPGWNQLASRAPPPPCSRVRPCCRATRQAKQRIDATLQSLGLAQSPIAILNPGAGWAAKQWDPARYGELPSLSPRAGCARSSTMAPASRRLARQVVAASQGNAVELLQLAQ